jgi:hypothetical protein
MDMEIDIHLAIWKMEDQLKVVTILGSMIKGANNM